MRPALETRARVLRTIRGFFHDRGFLEVTTPARIRAPAIEEHIDPEPAGDWFLRTSPELDMKRLLAAGCPRIFQVGPCFRRGERGQHHHPEYTMLEWYRAHANYADILLDTKALILAVAREALGSDTISYQGAAIDLALWERMTVSEAFLEFAGWDPAKDFDADRFDLDLVEKVEPQLPRHAPVVLTDFPAERAAFGRLKPGNPRLAERWELYIGGLELANACSELTDAAEQRARLERCAEHRAARGQSVWPADEDFLDALAAGMPPAAGIALGVDRLVMLLADKGSLEEILPFA
ncbi:MAG: EF-P lysine aminoacylase GenX [Kiritimatiellae bacterium]|nr:EF-P lysine aminoacylase GenX [Kiritimatiellia bacterium]